MSKLKPMLASGLLGFALGMGALALVAYLIMPGMMIVTKECKMGVDETVAALEESIGANGWVVSGVMDMNQSLAKHGVDFAPKVKLVKLCKAQYAQSVLSTDRHVACLMPCSMAVWEGDDGKVYLSEMNMGLMAKMFGGNIAKIMGGAVVSDEEAMLEGLVVE